MNDFKNFGIKPQQKSFEGDKIKMDRILNKPIIVEAFKIEQSKYQDKGSGKLLTLQIMVDSTKKIIFTGSTSLMDMIAQVPKNEFPFVTTIIRENERFEFT